MLLGASASNLLPKNHLLFQQQPQGHSCPKYWWRKERALWDFRLTVQRVGVHPSSLLLEFFPFSSLFYTPGPSSGVGSTNPPAQGLQKFTQNSPQSGESLLFLQQTSGNFPEHPCAGGAGEEILHAAHSRFMSSRSCGQEEWLLLVSLSCWFGAGQELSG